MSFDQWFSTRGNFVSQYRYLAMSEDAFCCHDLRGGVATDIWGDRGRGAVEHPGMDRPFLQNRNYAAGNVRRAGADKAPL